MIVPNIWENKKWQPTTNQFIWIIPEIGVPPVLIHLNRLFPNKNRPFWDTPMTMETSIWIMPAFTSGTGISEGIGEIDCSRWWLCADLCSLMFIQARMSSHWCSFTNVYSMVVFIYQCLLELFWCSFSIVASVIGRHWYVLYYLSYSYWYVWICLGT